MALTQVDQGLLGQYAQYTGFKNKIINGAMMIDQRNAGAAVAVTGNTGQMSVDRFLTTVYGSGTGRFTAQQSSTAPTGFTNSLSATVTTADASPSSAYAYSLAQIIEGYNVADLGWGAAGAATVTLSFWVRSSVTGTFPVVLTNNGLDRAYGATYTISSANTFEYKTITIAGDTSGTWAKNSSAGINVQFGLGGGSGRTVSAGWQAASGSTPTNVTGCTQLIATNGATFYITGVQLEKGSTATSFDYRPYGTELALCQRYYYRVTGSSGGAGYAAIGSGCANTATAASIMMPLPVSMRAAPTLNFSGTVIMTSANIDYVLTSIGVSYSGNAGTWAQLNASSATMTAGRGLTVYTSAATTNWFDFSAEL